jgi:hypothetical protein
MSSFCAGCGNSLSDGDTFCPICGRNLAPSAAAVDPGVAFGLAPETNGKAIFSLVCGVLSIFPPAAIVAVIFGHLSLSEIRRGGGRFSGKGLAITGLVFGYLAIASFATLLIIAAFSIPKAIKAENARRSSTTYSAHANSAVALIRAMNTAEIAYAQSHASEGYTCSLPQLSKSWALGTDLARARENGYTFALKGCVPKNPGGPIAKYQLVAYPTAPSVTGKAAFCSSESDAIRAAASGSARDCLIAGVELSEKEINHPQTWSQPSTD